MASINPLQATSSASGDAPAQTPVRTDRRLRSHGRRASRRAKLNRTEEVKKEELDDLGLPEWSGLRPIVLFLMFPATFAIAMASTGGGWPPVLMYGIAALLGLYVAFSAFRGVELVFACMVFYIPFQKTFAISIAPMVNGTNGLILLGLFASVMRIAERRQFLFGWPPGTTLMVAFGVLSMGSAFTVMRLPGGLPYLMYEEFLNYKSWVDQFLIIFIALCCIRDVQTAKRVWVYLCIGSMAVVLHTVPEFIDKMDRSTIDKSRLLGPHIQANNFGGFVAYSSLPICALFVVYIRQIRAWLVTPYLLVMLKILISSFSRGAYLAFAAGGLFVGYLKSGRFLLFWGLFAVATVAIFPQVLPESVLARLDSLTEDKVAGAAPKQLDKSSEVRLIMWRAASRMILENPILGKGFKAFPKLKSEYTEQYVHESDPHSMYLYIGSQMGLPAMVLFLYILGFATFLGLMLARSKVDRFSRAIGIGGAAAAVCYAIICVFGSRAVNADFTMYFWTYFIVMGVLYRDLIKGPDKRFTKGRNNAFSMAAQRAAAAAGAGSPKDASLASARRDKYRGAKPPSQAAAAPHRRSSASAKERHKLDRAARQAKRQSIKSKLGARRER